MLWDKRPGKPLRVTILAQALGAFLLFAVALCNLRGSVRRPGSHASLQSFQNISCSRGKRQYRPGVTKVHVAAVSGGSESPYPDVNNTERWQQLAASSPYDFEVLGRGQPWQGDKGVTKNKLVHYVKWLRTVPPEDIVILLDAHDVLFFPCGRDVVEEFHNLDQDIVFGADYTAFPDPDQQALYPSCPKNATQTGAFKYLNCGGIIAYAEDIQYYLTRYFLATGRSHNNFKDQQFWTDVYLSGVHSSGSHACAEPSIGLDYYGHIFQMFRAAPISDQGCWTMDLATRHITSALLCPGLYDQEACILHGPGYSKKTFWAELVPRWRAANSSFLF